MYFFGQDSIPKFEQKTHKTNKNPQKEEEKNENVPHNHRAGADEGWVNPKRAGTRLRVLLFLRRADKKDASLFFFEHIHF